MHHASWRRSEHKASILTPANHSQGPLQFAHHRGMTTVGPPLHPSPASSQMPSLSPLNRMTDFCAQLKHRIFRQPGRSVRTRYRWSPVHLPVNLNVVANTNYHGCLGLPQELINHILDMLRDDIRSLKACSLTCKAMFASTRPLIHQTLYLTILNNERVLTQREKGERDSTIGRYYLDLRFLSYMGEHGLLQYTRRVCICSYNRFTPDISRPHLRHFQTLDRVHTLTIEYCYCPAWALERYHESCFAHFYPTLTSLAIRSPTEGSESILQFALQFPKLENLCLESARRAPLSGLCWPVPDNFCHPPPLCGHLRLLGYDTMDQWPVDPSHELSGVIRFRSVELVDFLGEVATHILNTCAGSLEDLTVAPHKNSTRQLSFPLLATVEHLADITSTRARAVAVSRSHKAHCSPSVHITHANRSEVRSQCSPLRSLDNRVSHLP